MNIRIVNPGVQKILATNGLDPESIIAPPLDPRESNGRRLVGVSMHGLTGTDNVVMKGERAWHGLGVNVLGAESGMEMLKLGGLDWTVQQLPLYAALPQVAGADVLETLEVPTHLGNYRSDNNGFLGVVGKGYKPFHNAQLIDLVTALGGDKDVQVESVGTLQGGRRVWALVRGESFAVTPSDVTASYLAVCAGHDGSMAINLFWTSVRLACLNTFRRAFAGRKNGVVIRHEGGVMEKVGAAKVALGLMAETTRQEAAESMALNARLMKVADLQRFFLDVYTAAEGPVVQNPTNDAETKAKERAVKVLAEWGQMFDDDRKRVGGNASAWTAFNAVTEWYDHKRPVKGKNDAVRNDNRLYGNLWGQTADRKQVARDMALAVL